MSSNRLIRLSTKSLFFILISGRLFIILLLFIVIQGCKKTNQLFQLIPKTESGIYFSNDLTLTDSFDILDYMYFFNGGGVAAGDLNNDGLIDLYFTGNLVSGRLFINLGNLKFKDITDEAKVATTGWGSGVTIVDVNADGWQDIYLCQTGYPEPERRKNLLFINQGNLTFKEEAEKYGLADTSYSTQAAFFDFDRDGDLDVYLLNHDHQFRGTNLPLSKRNDGSTPNTDKLLENRLTENGQRFFYDISHKAGIRYEGFGLGVSISDLNNDLWPDIYVSNDFISNDLLYLNQQDGTFINAIDSVILHQSYNGMGNDVADFNNDGLPDIFVADMLPYLNSRRKMMAMNTSEDLNDASIEMGYAPQYTRNTLQLNNGFYPDGNRLLPFSEIGSMLNVQQTDWSWSPVFADVDNDGWKDLFISNGYYRDITDLDFITYRRHRATFTTQASQDSLYIQLMQELPPVMIPNFIYRNRKPLGFVDSSTTWGLEAASLSNGSLLVDLDNDGDLEIVTNNLDQAAFLYENRAIDLGINHFLKVQLKGPDSNRAGIGSKIYLYQESQIQLVEKQLSHGYMSAVNSPIHFGLGSNKKIDSLVVQWPDGTEKMLENVPPDTLLEIQYNSFDLRKSDSYRQIPIMPWFRDVTDELGLKFRHHENAFQDFKQDRNLPFMLSHQGPAVAVGDLNGDHLDDLFIGGAAGFPASIFQQKVDGTFRKVKFDWHSDYEDTDAIFFDADQDGDQDLYVVSGGVEFNDSEMYLDRIYLNDGQGRFQYDSSALPQVNSSGSAVAAGDFDRDGDLDLLVCGRIVPNNYGANARSYLLENLGGKFVDVTEKIAPDLAFAGMITAAGWTDINGDQQLDFAVVGDWMPVTTFINEEGIFRREVISISDSIKTDGWWKSIVITDLDLDGDPDIVVGNSGSNLDIKIDQQHPASLYFSDFDRNGSKESIITYFQQADEGGWEDFPALERNEMIDKVATWKKQFFDYRSYAYTSSKDLFSGAPELRRMAYLQESVYFLNTKGKFEMKVLPVRAQFSVINGVLMEDLNNDSYADILAIGNNYEGRVSTGNLDASLGILLLNDGTGGFNEVTPAESQFIAGGNTRRLVKLIVKDRPIYVVVRNADYLSAFEMKVEFLKLKTFR